MNARAAWRLERLGFGRVYRYPAGKADWMAAGLPTEGRNAGALRAGTVARRDVPTCGPDERVADAAKRARDAGSDLCVVVNDQRVVLGRLREGALQEGSDEAVEDVMEEGPTTTRANSDLQELATRLHDHDVASILVTDPDGRLIGVAYRDDADAVLSQSGDSAASANQ
ncbi:MAG: CBS domain-containing protein [Actinomycetota bacterium]|nr:CBS domain-containing protein [Actinomycetota bacterium]